MADRKSDPANRSAAQLVRRVDLSNNQELVAELAAQSRGEAVDTLLALPLDEGKVANPIREKKDGDAANNNVTDREKQIVWWFKKIQTTENPLQERMAWFWQTFLTSHQQATSQQGIGDQLDIFRSQGLGNFRDILTAFMQDRTLIIYLNGDANTASKPNENLARELMELFSLGVGNYSEDDVRNGALGLAGWRKYNDDPGIPDGVDKEGKPKIAKDPQKAGIRFEEKHAHKAPVKFLGETKVWDVVSIVNKVCDQPATHARVASLMFYHLGGKSLSSAEAKELGVWWAGQDLEIKPLVKKILTDPSLESTYYARPRSGFEYFCATVRATGRKLDTLKSYEAKNVGQLPYEPPNVAGWPDDRWLDPDSLLRRSNFINGFNKGNSTILAASTVDEILDRCGLYEISPTSQSVISSLTKDGVGDEGLINLRWRVALSSPEFMLT